MPHILIVDHSPTTEKTVRSHLVGTDFQVLSVESGEEALELCKEACPDFCLVSQVLSGINGIETIRKLAAAHSGVSLALLSRRRDLTAEHWARGAGADGCLVTPIEKGELLAFLEPPESESLVTTISSPSEWAAITGSSDELVLTGFSKSTPDASLHEYLEEVAKAVDGNVRVVMASIEDVPEVAERLGVQRLPAYVLTRGDETLEHESGSLEGPNGVFALLTFLRPHVLEANR